MNGLFASFMFALFVLGQVMGSSAWAQDISSENSVDTEWFALSRKGVASLQAGSLESAEDFFRQATRYALGFEEDDPRKAQSISNLAYSLLRQGRAIEAEASFREALRLREISFGVNHPQVARSLRNLSHVLLSLSKASEAETYLKRALKITLGDVGDLAPETAETLDLLGQALSLQGDYKTAEIHLNKALEIREQGFGTGHSLTARTRFHLAQVAYGSGNVEEGRALAGQALQTFRNAEDPKERQELVSILLRLSSQERGSQENGAAISFATEAVEESRKVYGETHAEHVRAAVRLASLLEEIGRHEDAVQVAARAIGNAPGGAIETANLRLNLLLILSESTYRLEEFNASKQWLLAAISAGEELHGAGHPLLATPLHNLAMIAMQDEDWNTSLALLKRAISIEQRIYGRARDKRQASLDAAITVAERIGDDAERDKLIEQREKLEDP